MPILLCLAGLAVAALPPAHPELETRVQPAAPRWLAAALPLTVLAGVAALVVLIS